MSETKELNYNLESLSDTTANSGPNLDQEYLFYYNDSLVAKSFLDLDDTTLIVVLTSEVARRDSVDYALIRIHGFTNNVEYIKWGEKHNLAVELFLDVESHLANYADTSGAIAYFELYGSIPSWYTDYEEDYLDDIFGSIEMRAPTFLRKNCGGGNGLPMVKSYAFMPPSWNNKVQSFEYLGLYGYVGMWDRAFYNIKLFNWFDWGWHRICLEGELERYKNRMSSGVSF